MQRSEPGRAAWPEPAGLDRADPNQPEPEITAAAIITATAEFFAVSIEDLQCRRRTHAIAQARQIAMYLCRALTDLSLPAIGRAFGGRDHTTVLHAQRKIRASVAESPAIHHQVQQLAARITRGGGGEARR